MDVRSRILEAALGLLAEGGELTQPRVAAAAGVRQSHLTYYFPTVTDLMQSVARHSFESLGRERGARGAGGIAAATLDKRRVRLMLALVLAADRDASLKPRMRAFVKEIRARLAASSGPWHAVDLRHQSGGQIRLCDPKVDTGGTDPRRCPAP